MAYSTAEIIIWSKICQPLARIGEAKKISQGNREADVNLDIKLYDTRKDVEYAYAQSADTDVLFPISNYLLTLCGVYLFTAQATVAGGGTITPIVPSLLPDPYDFEVSASSFIVTGATTKVFPSSWIGLNILFVRNSITQSLTNQGATYYSFDRTSATLTLIGGAAQSGELFQIYPII